MEDSAQPNKTVGSAQPKKIMTKPRRVWIFLILLVAILGVAYLVISSNSQVVANGDLVQVYYTGKFTNGTVFDSNFGRQPLNFTVGSNQLITGFDEAVVGMRLNETKNVTLSPNEAYGQVNPSMIVEVPLNTFGNQTVETGMIVTRTSNGQQYQGIVISTNATGATINFNPPLAGQTLIFTIKVVGIQKK
jgi:FKBP-type peptidyl-prolyl cis-trans isomerase 2